MNFTYRIKWSATNMSYYGVRYKEGETTESLMTTYFTSSTYVKDYIEVHGLPDIIEVRKTFNTKLEAKQWEERVISKGKLYRSPDRWLNRGNNGSFKNIVMNADIIQKIIESRAKGDKTKKKVYNNGSDNIMIKIGNPIPEGFKIGRLPSAKQQLYYDSVSERMKARDPEKVKEIGRKISLKTKGKKKPPGHGENVSKATKGKKKPQNCGDNNVSRRPEVREKLSKSWENRESIVWFYKKESDETMWVYVKDINSVDLHLWTKGKPLIGKWYNDGDKNIWVRFDSTEDITALYKGKIFVQRKWVNNGIINLRLKSNEPTPEGFVKGRKDEHRKNTGYYCNNGVKDIIVKIGESIPEGFVLGKKVRIK